MAKQPPYRALLLLFFLSGGCGLMYEVAWARILSLTFGNTYLAISTVVGAFMGGLGLGGLLGGRLSHRIRNGVRAYALLEVAIGAVSFFTPALFYGTGPLHRALAGLAGFETPAFALFRFLAIFLLLLVPTLLMGASLPILCRHLVRSRSRVCPRVGHLYAINTLGAAAGAFAAGFYLIEALGNSAVVHVAAVINALIGIAAWGLGGAGAPVEASKAGAGPARRPGRQDRGKRSPAAPDGPPVRWVYAITGISGFVSMGLQIVWVRAFRHFISNSTYAFSLIIVVYLVGIGAGSLAAGRWIPRARRPFLLFGLLEAALGVLSLLSLPILSRLFYLEGFHAFLFSGVSIPFAERVFRYGLAALIVILPPTFVMGLVFPLAVSLYTRAVSGVGRFVGDLYFINTVGSIAGSLTAGFLLLPLLGINGSILLSSTLIAACGLLVILRAAGGSPGERAAAAVGVPVLFAMLYFSVPAGFVYRGVLEDPQREVLYYDEGVMSTVKVFESFAGIRTMSVDGNSIGSAPYTYADMKQRLMAHLPMLLGRGGGEILNVGLGTGITAGCFTLYPEVSRVEAVEIVPGVITGARLFGEDNRGIFANPAVEIRASDAMTVLQVVDRRYDLIASDGKLNPLYSGNSIVLCREFYGLCRARLAPGGRFAQWINASIPTREFLIVLKTISGVFPEVDIFYFPPANIFFLAGDGPLRIDPSRLDTLFRGTPGVAEDLAMYHIDDPAALPGGWIGGAEAFTPLLQALPVNSWDRTVIEFETPRIWFERPKERNVAETLGLFLRHGTAMRRGAGVAGRVEGFARMGEAEREAILRAAAINRLYMETVVLYLTSRDRSRYRGALERILEIDPDNRRARAWTRDARRFITF